jgi:hypothetical protein
VDFSFSGNANLLFNVKNALKNGLNGDFSAIKNTFVRKEKQRLISNLKI